MALPTGSISASQAAVVVSSELATSSRHTALIGVIQDESPAAKAVQDLVQAYQAFWNFKNLPKQATPGATSFWLPISS